MIVPVCAGVMKCGVNMLLFVDIWGEEADGSEGGILDVVVCGHHLKHDDFWCGM